jgi:hypothetical protein
VLSVFVCVWYWGLNSDLAHARQAFYHLSHTPTLLCRSPEMQERDMMIVLCGCRMLGFYTNWGGKQMKGFRQKSDMIQFMFSNIPLATVWKGTRVRSGKGEWRLGAHLEATEVSRGRRW